MREEDKVEEKRSTKKTKIYVKNRVQKFIKTYKKKKKVSLDRLLGFVKARVSRETLAGSVKVCKNEVNAKIR